MWYLVGGIALGAVILGVLYLIARSATDKAARVQAEALQEQERARREALEEAAEADRAARAKELDDKIASVRDADDAARLLREQLSRR